MQSVYTFLCCLVFLGCSQIVNAETWTSVGGGIGSYVYAMVIDNNNNLYVAGNFDNYIKKWNGSA